MRSQVTRSFLSFLFLCKLEDFQEEWRSIQTAAHQLLPQKLKNDLTRTQPVLNPYSTLVLELT